MCWFTYYWEKPFKDVSGSNFESSEVWTSLVHHAGDLALKSPVSTAKDGLHLLISLQIWSKLVKNESNSQLFWLGER